MDSNNDTTPEKNNSIIPPKSNQNVESDVVYKEKTLPIQLQTDCVRLIKLHNPTSDPKFPKSGKEPMEKDWTTINNFGYKDSHIANHINAHCNYGVIPTNNLCILDVDDIKAFRLLEAEGKIDFDRLFGDTFTVVSGHASENHAHYYFKTENKRCQIKKKIVLHHPDTGDHLGEIYPSDSRAFVVGPNSKHESGRRYKANDAEIKTVDDRQLENFIDYFLSESSDEQQYQKRIPIGFEVSQSTLSSKLGLRIEDLAMPDNARPLGDGEYQGGHPIHGSTTGHNFNINVHKNVWKCFRCDSGGDPAVWLAVLYGIIDCKDAQPGVLDDPELFKRLKSRMEEDPRFSDAIKKMDAEYRAEMELKREQERSQKSYDRFIRNLELHAKENDFYNPDGEIVDSNDYSILEKEDGYSASDFGEDAIAECVKDQPVTPIIKSEFDDETDDSEYEEPEIEESAGPVEPDFDALFISKMVYSDGKARIPTETEKFLARKKNAEVYSRHYKYIKDTTPTDVSELIDFKNKDSKRFMFKNGKVKCTVYKTDNPHVVEMKLRDIFEPIPADKLRYKCLLDKDNFISKYFHTISLKTDAYHEYHFAAAFSLLSTIVDKKAVMGMESGDIFTNTWCFILGISSSSRKSTSIGFAQKLAEMINNQHKLPSDFTPESLIEMMANESHRYFFKDEAGTLLAAFNKSYMSSTRDIFMELYDNKEYQRKLRTKKDTPDEFNVKNPYLILFLSTTYDTFAKYTSSIDLTSGFLYRFLMFTPKYEKEVSPLRPRSGANSTDEPADIRELKMSLESKGMLFQSASKPIEFVFSDFGLEFFQEWQMLRERQCDARNNQVERSTISRLIPYAIKLSMLFEIGRMDFVEHFRGSGYKVPTNSLTRIHIHDEYIIEACRQIDEYFYPASVMVDNEIGLDENTNDIIKIKMTLERCGGKMSRTLLMRETHLKKKEFNEAIESMQISRIVECKVDKREKLKPTTYYSLIRDLTDESDWCDPDILDAIKVSDKNKQDFERKYGKIDSNHAGNAREPAEINSVKPKKPVNLGF